jgi:subtilisin family serine protease
MATDSLKINPFALPDDDDCWHLDDPHHVEVWPRPTAAANSLKEAPGVYKAAALPGNHVAGQAPDSQSEDDSALVDAYRRVGINAREAWKRTTGKGVRVVIFDHGVDFEHPSLKDNIGLDAARDFDHDPGGKGRSHQEGGRIDNRFNAHGTACAGIVAAAALSGVRVVGVAPKATLVPIRISTNFETGALINALEYARGVGDVILVPRYLPESPELSEKINEVAREVPVVCASGNDGTNFLVHPASLEGTIAVGACNEKGYRSTYSQYGEGLDVVAPSNDLAVEDATVVRLDLDEANFRVRAEAERQARLANRPVPNGRPLDLNELLKLQQAAAWNLDKFGSLSIATTDNRGDFGYNDEPPGDFCPATGDFGFGGTSAAAAQVAGVVALMLGVALERHGGDRDAVRKYLPPETIRQLLKETANMGDLHPEPGRRTVTDEFGAGLVDAAAAVDRALAAR